MKQSNIAVLIGLFCIGVLFRLWIAALVPQPFVYDQEEYYGYALGIIKHGLHADLYRLYGYPLIITPLIYFFGVKSAVPWTLFHAILDTATAVLVYWIARYLSSPRTPRKDSGQARGSSVQKDWIPGPSISAGRQARDDDSTAAWIAFLLYLFNPFTAGYVGVLLSEVVTVFLVTLVSALLIRFVEKQSSRMLFVLALLLGFLPQVRPVFILLSFATVCLLVRTKPYRVKMATIILFSIPFWYTIAGNAVYYKQLSILGVEPTVVRELYASLFIGRGMPFTDTKWGDWPVEAQKAWGAFTAPKDAAGRRDVADRHLRMATEIIRRDPFRFIQSRIAKMGYVWEKHFLYPYVMGKPSALTKALTYWGNLALLAAAAIGMVLAWKRNRRVVLVASSFFLYISLAHIFSTSEERFSLPAYPWLMIFAAYSLWTIAVYVRQRYAVNVYGIERPTAGHIVRDTPVSGKK